MWVWTLQLNKMKKDPVWDRTNKFTGRVINCNHPVFLLTVITRNYKLTHKQTVVCRLCGYKLRSKSYQQSDFKK